jgi:FkbM family methyltransferase
MRKAHGGDPRVRIIPCAISGTSGEAVFHLSSNDGLSSSLLPFGTHTAHDPDVTFVEDLRVPCWTLADAKAQFGLGDPDLLFLDVQGAEYDILAAIPGDLLAKVKILFTEVSLEEIYRGGRTLPELSALLAETFKCAGYAPMQGHKGMHGNALYLNQAFMDGAAGWGPSPLLDSSGAMAGPLLSAEAAEALRAILREGLFGELFRNAGQAGRDVYLWGAGTLGRDLLAMLAGLGMEIKGVLDNSSARWGEAFHGTRILEPARVLGSEPKPYVVIGTVHHAAVARQLEEAGFTPAGDFQSVTDIY